MSRVRPKGSGITAELNRTKFKVAVSLFLTGVIEKTNQQPPNPLQRGATKQPPNPLQRGATKESLPNNQQITNYARTLVRKSNIRTAAKSANS